MGVSPGLMSKKHDRGRLDWLVELVGASMPAAATAFAAMKLAPINGWALSSAVLLGFGGTFAAAFIAMRIVPAEARHLALTDFEPAAVPAVEAATDELLLVERYEAPDELYLDQPLEVAASDAVAELLLDDALPAPTPDSRVVQLFADGRMPTAGQLVKRIDRHLAEASVPAQAPSSDASDALNEALAQLRRSLRQA